MFADPTNMFTDSMRTITGKAATKNGSRPYGTRPAACAEDAVAAIPERFSKQVLADFARRSWGAVPHVASWPVCSPRGAREHRYRPSTQRREVGSSQMGV